MFNLTPAVWVAVICTLLTALAYGWFKWLNRNPYPTPPRTPFKPIPSCTLVDAAEALESPKEEEEEPEPKRVPFTSLWGEDFIPFHETSEDLFAHVGADVYLAYLTNRDTGGRAIYSTTMFDCHMAVNSRGYDRSRLKFICDVGSESSRADVQQALSTLSFKVRSGQSDEPWED